MHEAIQSSLEMHKSAISMKKGVEKRVEIFSTLYEAEDSRYVLY